MSREAAPLPRAMDVLGQLDASAPEAVRARLESLAPEAAEIIMGYAFTDVLGRAGLDLRTREMLTVAMLSAMGTAPDQLAFHMRAARATGVRRDEIVEIVLQVSVYAGVPAAMNAVTAALAAFDDPDES
ncbi:carboxymuconolactone decarboxylase family protein [Dinoroseobacter sp. S375]|uniref:carboxymuconolactone decarboxylase family protein n=1 Tax=Dinoroseobacter sp. S375 TaxID=3415136 RepID=UPI003C7D7011